MTKAQSEKTQCISLILFLFGHQLVCEIHLTLLLLRVTRNCVTCFPDWCRVPVRKYKCVPNIKVCITQKGHEAEAT